MIAIEEKAPVLATLPDMVRDITFFSTDGTKYILDLDSLKKPEDIITVLKHFASRVELRGYETIGIEPFVKPVTDNITH